MRNAFLDKVRLNQGNVKSGWTKAKQFSRLTFKTLTSNQGDLVTWRTADKSMQPLVFIDRYLWVAQK